MSKEEDCFLLYVKENGTTGVTTTLLLGERVTEAEIGELMKKYSDLEDGMLLPLRLMPEIEYK